MTALTFPLIQVDFATRTLASKRDSACLDLNTARVSADPGRSGNFDLL